MHTVTHAQKCINIQHTQAHTQVKQLKPTLCKCTQVQAELWKVYALRTWTHLQMVVLFMALCVLIRQTITPPDFSVMLLNWCFTGKLLILLWLDHVQTCIPRWASTADTHSSLLLLFFCNSCVFSSTLSSLPLLTCWKPLFGLKLSCKGVWLSHLDAMGNKKKSWLVRNDCILRDILIHHPSASDTITTMWDN